MRYQRCVLCQESPRYSLEVIGIRIQINTRDQDYRSGRICLSGGLYSLIAHVLLLLLLLTEIFAVICQAV